MLNCDFRNIGSIPITYLLVTINNEILKNNLINKPLMSFWIIKIEILLQNNLLNSVGVKKKINKYINYYNKSSYSFINQDSFEKLSQRWFKKNLKKINQLDNKRTTKFYSKLELFLKDIVNTSFLNILFNYLIRGNFYFNKFKIFVVLFIHFKKICAKFFFKSKIIMSRKNTSYFLNSLELIIDISKKQPLVTLINNNLLCYWTCSAGLILTRLNLKEQKYLKKTRIFWPIFFKAILKKIITNKPLVFKNNFLIINGQHKFFFKLLLIIWKLNFLTHYNFLILQSNLSFNIKKYKKIKAIKRKLTKRFVKIELQQNIEFKNLKKNITSN